MYKKLLLREGERKAKTNASHDFAFISWRRKEVKIEVKMS